MSSTSPTLSSCQLVDSTSCAAGWTAPCDWMPRTTWSPTSLTSSAWVSELDEKAVGYFRRFPHVVLHRVPQRGPCRFRLRPLHLPQRARGDRRCQAEEVLRRCPRREEVAFPVPEVEFLQRCSSSSLGWSSFQPLVCSLHGIGRRSREVPRLNVPFRLK